jgi:hypothetical protein
MDLLETVLAYVAEDNALFQRLKTDLAKDGESQAEPTAEPTAEPGTTEPSAAPAAEPPAMRGLKS